MRNYIIAAGIAAASVGVALAFGAIMLVALGANPLTGYQTMFSASVSSKRYKYWW